MFLSISRYFAPILYVELSPERLTVCNLTRGVRISEKPEIAMLQKDQRNTVIAIGDQAKRHKGKPSVTMINPFVHPRTLLPDISVASRVLKDFVERVCPRSAFRAPILLMHPLGQPEGGFTEVELGTLDRMGRDIRAHKTLIWLEREISTQEMLSKDFLLEMEALMKKAATGIFYQ